MTPPRRSDRIAARNKIKSGDNQEDPGKELLELAQTPRARKKTQAAIEGSPIDENGENNDNSNQGNNNAQGNANNNITNAQGSVSNNDNAQSNANNNIDHSQGSVNNNNNTVDQGAENGNPVQVHVGSNKDQGDREGDNQASDQSKNDTNTEDKKGSKVSGKMRQKAESQHMPSQQAALLSQQPAGTPSSSQAPLQAPSNKTNKSSEDQSEDAKGDHKGKAIAMPSSPIKKAPPVRQPTPERPPSFVDSSDDEGKKTPEHDNSAEEGVHDRQDQRTNPNSLLSDLRQRQQPVPSSAGVQNLGNRRDNRRNWVDDDNDHVPVAERPAVAQQPPTARPERGVPLSGGRADQGAPGEDPTPNSANRGLRILELGLTSLILMLIFSMLDCSLFMADKAHRCPNPDKGGCPRDDKIPVIISSTESKSEPLPVFNDLTALYRSWATFSTWKPFDSSVTSFRLDDQPDFEPVFSKLLELGDLYDLTTDQFLVALEGTQRLRLLQSDRQNLTTETRVDLIELRDQVSESLQNLNGIFEASSRPGTDWIAPVENRLRDLIQRTESEMKQDTRLRQGSGDSLYNEETILSAHLEQVEHIQYLQDTAQRQDENAGSLEQFAMEGSKDGQLFEIMKSLLDAQGAMEVLNRVTARSSAEYLYGASRDLSNTWSLFELFAAPYGITDPLRKAVQQSEVLKEIADDRKRIQHMSEEIGSLVESLTRIINCERAIDRHIDVLEKTSADKSSKALSDGYLFYKWDTRNRGWMTVRRKVDGDQKPTLKELGQIECRSLYDFQRDSSEETFLDLTPSSSSANETVLQFVPAAKYLHAKYRSDKGFVDRVAGEDGNLVETSYVADEGFESTDS